MRYGNDVEVDTNLFADPPLAAADIERKVTFQKRQFEKKLIELGYDALRDDSTNIITAFARTIQGSPNAREKSALEHYFNNCFAAFNKCNVIRDQNGAILNVGTPANPLPKILTMARQAMAATAATPDAMYVKVLNSKVDSSNIMFLGSFPLLSIFTTFPRIQTVHST